MAEKEVEFFAYDPYAGQQAKHLLRGLPPSIESKDIFAGLREKGTETSHVHQVKRNLMVDGIRTTYFLSVWIVTVNKNVDNVNKLKSVTGILNFLIRIQDYKAPDRVM